jgi:hypothetical protein
MQIKENELSAVYDKLFGRNDGVYTAYVHRIVCVDFGTRENPKDTFIGRLPSSARFDMNLEGNPEIGPQQFFDIDRNETFALLQEYRKNFPDLYVEVSIRPDIYGGGLR